jgi:hypothetical protein
MTSVVRQSNCIAAIPVGISRPCVYGCDVIRGQLYRTLAPKPQQDAVTPMLDNVALGMGVDASSSCVIAISILDPGSRLKRPLP